MQGEFNLTLVEDGILPASMVFGLMLAAPAAAQLRRAAPPLRLMGCGFLLWAAAAATCAAAPSYGVLLAARLAIGVGVGPFIALASPLVDDAAPRDKKSLWLSLLFLCIPVGFALGYVYGGLVSSPAWVGRRGGRGAASKAGGAGRRLCCRRTLPPCRDRAPERDAPPTTHHPPRHPWSDRAQVGSAYGWRTAFAFEAAAMLPLAALTLLAPPVELRGAKPVAEGAAGATCQHAILPPPTCRVGRPAPTDQPPHACATTRSSSCILHTRNSLPSPPCSQAPPSPPWPTWPPTAASWRAARWPSSPS